MRPPRYRGFSSSGTRSRSQLQCVSSCEASGLPSRRRARASLWGRSVQPLANVSMDTHLARQLPSASLAPAFAFQRAVVRTPGLISTGLIGLLLTLGTATTLATAGSWMILAAAAALLIISRGNRHVDRPHALISRRELRQALERRPRGDGSTQYMPVAVRFHRRRPMPPTWCFILPHTHRG